MRRQSVITGIGTACGLGVGAEALWAGLCEGRCAIGIPTRVDLSGFPCQLGAEIPDFSAKDYVPKGYRKAVKVMARDIEIAVACAKLAVDDAGLITRGDEEGRATTYPGERVGCQIGAGLIAAETLELTMALASSRSASPTPEQARRGGFDYRAWGTIAPEDDAGQRVGGMENLQPLWMLKYLPNMLACHVTIIHGCEGPSNTHTNAEASGLLSLGEASRVIERGSADACLSGSAESKLNLMGMLRLTKAGRYGVIPKDTDPRKAVRPYDPGATGSLPGEGGGIFVLEEAGSARARGAQVYARLSGFGAAQSVLKEMAPFQDSAPLARGMELAIRATLRDAGLQPEQIDAVVPQACGEPVSDAGERAALRAVFGDRLEREGRIVTLAPMIGDCAAGTGGMQVAVAALMLKHQRSPARLDTGAVSRSLPLRHVLLCCGSLGGQNAAMVLSATP
jgi:3-oxoacyl-[acyl-carrier-protein] synthase II